MREIFFFMDLRLTFFLVKLLYHLQVQYQNNFINIKKYPSFVLLIFVSLLFYQIIYPLQQIIHILLIKLNLFLLLSLNSSKEVFQKLFIILHILNSKYQSPKLYYIFEHIITVYEYIQVNFSII